MKFIFVFLFGFILMSPAMALECDNLPENAVLFSDATTCDDWFCDTNFYQDGNACTPCPDGSFTASDGATSLTQCVCQTYTHLLYNSEIGAYACGRCPGHSTYDSGTMQCLCSVSGADTTTCECPIGSTYDNINNICNCSDADSPVRTLDENGLVVCSSCAANATFRNGNCECNIGYFGNGYTNCERCPAGMVTHGYGSTSQNACQISRTTVFCDAEGANCMNLL